MAKRKQKSIAKLVDEAAVLLQLLVRLKAADEHGMVNCVTCGARKHYKEVDGGHSISRRHVATKLMEEVVNPQCKQCNGFKGGAYGEYTLYMIDTHGRDFVDWLNIEKHKPKKYYRDEIEEIKAGFRTRIKEQEDRING